MDFLIFIPIMIISAIILLVSSRYNTWILKPIAKIALVVSIIAFIYLFGSYYNWDLSQVLAGLNLNY